MTEPQRQSARRRYQRESESLCHTCGGTGRMLSPAIVSRARKGGNASFLASLEHEQLSMSERGSKGGRPNEPTLQELNGRPAQP